MPFRSYVCSRAIRSAAASALILMLAAACHAPGTSASADAAASRPGYLLLVNTAIAFMMDDAKFRQFNQSAYDGIAVAFLHAYETSPPPPASEMAAKIAGWKKATSKDIWPWVYVNRIIGKSPTEDNHYADIPYFHKIAGADLDDKFGARSAFLETWRNSLAAARDTKAPGVVCDLEFYNFYKEYNVAELAQRTAKTPAEAIARLKALGSDMADVAATEYPQAILWFLFTGFTHPTYKTIDGVPYYPSPTYIAMGLLDRIASRKLSLKVLTGGEGSLGYCHDSLSSFQSAIKQRETDMLSTLSKYSGSLELAGTMTLWSDAKAKQGWVNEGACKSATAANVEELEPYLELLLRSYRYNWIYAAGDGGYLPFSPQSAPRFDIVIRTAIAQTSAPARH